MRPWPASCRTPDGIDRSGVRRFAYGESCASPAPPDPTLLLLSMDCLRARRSSSRLPAHVVFPIHGREVRTDASAAVFGTTTARSNRGNRWYRIHGHPPLSPDNPVPRPAPCTKTPGFRSRRWRPAARSEISPQAAFRRSSRPCRACRSYRCRWLQSGCSESHQPQSVSTPAQRRPARTDPEVPPAHQLWRRESPDRALAKGCWRAALPGPDSWSSLTPSHFDQVRAPTPDWRRSSGHLALLVSFMLSGKHDLGRRLVPVPSLPSPETEPNDFSRAANRRPGVVVSTPC